MYPMTCFSELVMRTYSSACLSNTKRTLILSNKKLKICSLGVKQTHSQAPCLFWFLHFEIQIHDNFNWINQSIAELWCTSSCAPRFPPMLVSFALLNILGRVRSDNIKCTHHQGYVYFSHLKEKFVCT